LKSRAKYQDEVSENIFKTFRQWGQKYYPIYSIRVLNVNAACILQPEDFEVLIGLFSMNWEFESGGFSLSYPTAKTTTKVLCTECLRSG
jgi:hypothetical protein